MDIKKSLQSILHRNKRVELDKAWETSCTRRIFLVLVTYLGAFVLLSMVQTKDPTVEALVPATAYLISTLSLPFLRKIWEKHQ